MRTFFSALLLKKKKKAHEDKAEKGHERMLEWSWIIEAKWDAKRLRSVNLKQQDT